MVKDQICSDGRQNGKSLPGHQNIENKKYKSKNMKDRPKRYNSYLVRVPGKESRDNTGKGMEERHQSLDPKGHPSRMKETTMPGHSLEKFKSIKNKDGSYTPGIFVIFTNQRLPNKFNN